VDACVAFAQLLAEAISGRSRDKVLAPRQFSGSTAIADILAGSWRGKPRGEIKSSGYVVHSLEAALWCVARTSSFRSAVTLAANLGDDADTLAAITGQLAGALYGLTGIPEAWLQRLAWRDKLESAARRLLTR
jgi:ADP-ribosyl-[dinitrogen reductase] hydrolase